MSFISSVRKILTNVQNIAHSVPLSCNSSRGSDSSRGSAVDNYFVQTSDVLKMLAAAAPLLGSLFQTRRKANQAQALLGPLPVMLNEWQMDFLKNVFLRAAKPTFGSRLTVAAEMKLTKELHSQLSSVLTGRSQGFYALQQTLERALTMGVDVNSLIKKSCASNHAKAIAHTLLEGMLDFAVNWNDIVAEADLNISQAVVVEAIFNTALIESLNAAEPNISLTEAFVRWARVAEVPIDRVLGSPAFQRAAGYSDWHTASVFEIIGEAYRGVANNIPPRKMMQGALLFIDTCYEAIVNGSRREREMLNGWKNFPTSEDFVPVAGVTNTLDGRSLYTKPKIRFRNGEMVRPDGVDVTIRRALRNRDGASSRTRPRM